MIVHLNHKSTAENFDLHVTDTVVSCCGCLGISLSWMCGADCWPVSESGTENILASDSSSESPMVPNP